MINLLITKTFIFYETFLRFPDTTIVKELKGENIMNVFKRTIAVMMSAVILIGSGVIAANAAEGDSRIVETSTTITNAKGANTSKFTFYKETGELVLEELCDDDFRYSFYDDGPGGDVPWKSFRNDIKTVTITSNCNSIPNGCFAHCMNLTKVTIPDSVSYIGEYAFRCSGIESIELPEGLELIDYGAFEYCIYLKSIKIPQRVDEIYDHTFFGCTSLESIELPDGVKHIGDEAFEDCNSLKSIKFPSQLEGIGEEAFRYCFSLRHIDIPDSVTYICKKAFNACSNLTSARLGENLDYISEDLFFNCKKLTEIEFKSDVKKICSCAFKDTGIYNDESNWEDGALYIGSCLYKARDGKKNFTVRDGTTLISDKAFSGNKQLISVSLPDSLKYIGESAFAECDQLKSVSFNEGLREIIEYSFYNCKSLTEIKLPSSLEVIDSEAFRGCENLTKVTFSEGIEIIGDDLFVGCPKLKTVTIPKSVTEIGYGAFFDCAEGFTIKGYENTAAHEYAKEDRARFYNLETKQVINYGKKNPIKVTAKKKTLKAKTLKAKTVKVRLLTVKKTEGKVRYGILAVSKKLKGKVSVSKKGVFTFKKGWYKKGNFKIKVHVTAKGNEEYLRKRVEKIVEISIK